MLRLINKQINILSLLGFAGGFPSSNNTLESKNRYINEHSTLRKSQQLSEFLDAIENHIIKFRSIQRASSHPNQKLFYATHEISEYFQTSKVHSLEEWTLVHQWIQRHREKRNNTPIYIKLNAYVFLHFIRSKNNPNITKQIV